jgi:hypothetical protein
VQGMQRALCDALHSARCLSCSSVCAAPCAAVLLCFCAAPCVTVLLCCCGSVILACFRYAVVLDLSCALCTSTLCVPESCVLL